MYRQTAGISIRKKETNWKDEKRIFYSKPWHEMDLDRSGELQPIFFSLFNHILMARHKQAHYTRKHF